MASPALPFLEKSPTDPCPFSKRAKISKSSSCTCQVLFKLLLRAGAQTE